MVMMMTEGTGIRYKGDIGRNDLMVFLEAHSPRPQAGTLSEN